MMKIKSTRSQAGFSLVELMVVVAIIGALASIAVPGVQKFLAKARQSEAKTNLSALYTGEKAFIAEYNIGTTNFDCLGFKPEGKLRYRVGFDASDTNDETNWGASSNCAADKFSTLNFCGTGSTCTELKDAQEALTNTTEPTAGNPQEFQAEASGRIFKNQIDRWTIDHNKNLVNSVDGLGGGGGGTGGT